MSGGESTGQPYRSGAEQSNRYSHGQACHRYYAWAKPVRMGYSTGIVPEPSLVTVKVPVFSFAKLTTVDIFLGPEMKSTGEVMGTDTTYYKAMYKALLAAGMHISPTGNILFSVADRDKLEAFSMAAALGSKGYNIYATDGTYEYFLKRTVCPAVS